jgi:hypothetical protein
MKGEVRAQFRRESEDEQGEVFAILRVHVPGNPAY